MARTPKARQKSEGSFEAGWFGTHLSGTKTNSSVPQRSNLNVTLRMKFVLVKPADLDSTGF
jgi:hypothetical protein